MQGVRELGIFSPKWLVAIDSLPPTPQDSGNCEKKRHKEWTSQQRWKTAREPDSLNQYDRYSTPSAEPQTACTGPAHVLPDGFPELKSEADTCLHP